MRSEQGTAAPTSLEAGGKASDSGWGAWGHIGAPFALAAEQLRAIRITSCLNPSASQPAELQSRAVLELACHVSTDSVRGKLKGPGDGQRATTSEATSFARLSYESCSAVSGRSGELSPWSAI